MYRTVHGQPGTLFYVYILQSNLDTSLYIGNTKNLQERLLRHNQGRSPYTKSKRPWTLVYTEEFTSKATAMKREKALESLHRKDLLMKLIHNPR
jgi:putative endonuclease